MSSTGLISRARLHWIPAELRLSHEYCFFLHDEALRVLAEYEAAKAHFVRAKFRSKKQRETYEALLEKGPVDAMREAGFLKEARRVVLNTITMGMVSDCLHHIYEALRCMEKRKVVVAMNLLRKPLLDNLPYLSWMLADEDQFYAAFTTESPHGITQKRLGNLRREVITKALKKTAAGESLDADFLLAVLYDPGHPVSLYGLFQHAVHLVTVDRMELRTEPENFNFIFKSYEDDDLYEVVYDVLPFVMFYLSCVILELFQRMKPMDRSSKQAFEFRAQVGCYLVDHRDDAGHTAQPLAKLTAKLRCRSCGGAFVITHHNACRAVLSDSLRCTRCGTIGRYPISWAI